ncbi:FIST C-terminal domain-containing protein [Methanolobus sp. ZRKC2]|uniref:FIST signal transduction protein n=1 Tax=Methanolobus sp. ZRKC2 TaxID=3125783 RepID=UPI0032448AE0
MYLKSSFAEDIVREIVDLEMSDNEAVMILLAVEGQTDVDELIRQLNYHGIDFFGGIFPGLIHGTKVHHSGAVVQKFPLIEKPILVKGLDSQDFGIPPFEGKILENTSKKNTLMILLDGMTENITQLLHRTFNSLGNSVNYIGAGAGFLQVERNPCVFTPAGLFQDAAIIVPIGMESGLGVHHGLEFISGPIIVTKSNNHVIQELNWKNAYQEYKDTIEKAMGEKWNDDEFSELIENFSFGIYCEDREYIARVPARVTENGELICPGGMPENAALSILRSESKKMLQAASKAAKEAIHPKTKARNTLVVECLGRYNFLGNEFNAELSSIARELKKVDEKVIPEGILSVGEISSYQDGILEFFNCTVVVGRFYE